MSLWQAHPADEIELGFRAEAAMRFSFMYDVWVDPERHDPRTCPCYLISVFLNHKTFDSCDNYGFCQCVACVKLRKLWK